MKAALQDDSYFSKVGGDTSSDHNGPHHSLGAMVRPKEVVSVWIKLDLISVHVQCESLILKGLDRRTNDRKLQQATRKKENHCRLPFNMHFI